MGVKLYYRDPQKNLASGLYSSDLWVTSWSTIIIQHFQSIDTHQTFGWSPTKVQDFQLGPSVDTPENVENVVLWQGISPLPKGLMSVDWVTQLEMLYYGRGSTRYPTRRSDAYRLSDPIENVILWQGINSLPGGLMSIHSAIGVEMLYYSRGSVRYPKVW